jgi:hypothetical protein
MTNHKLAKLTPDEIARLQAIIGQIGDLTYDLFQDTCPIEDYWYPFPSPLAHNFLLQSKWLLRDLNDFVTDKKVDYRCNLSYRLDCWYWWLAELCAQHKELHNLTYSLFKERPEDKQLLSVVLSDDTFDKICKKVIEHNKDIERLKSFYTKDFSEVIKHLSAIFVLLIFVLLLFTLIFFFVY